MVLFSVLEHILLNTKILLDFSGNKRLGMQCVGHLLYFQRDNQSHAAPLNKRQARMGEAGNGHHVIYHVIPDPIYSSYRIAKERINQLNQWWLHIMT